MLQNGLKCSFVCRVVIGVWFACRGLNGTRDKLVLESHKAIVLTIVALVSSIEEAKMYLLPHC